MTPEARHAAAEELRAIALELNTAQDRLHAIAGLLKESNRVTDSSLAATTAAFHVLMLRTRMLVELIQECSTALCDWQAQTSAYLIERLKTNANPKEPS